MDVPQLRVLLEVLSSDLRMGAVRDSLDLASLARDREVEVTFCGPIDAPMRAEAERRGATAIDGRSRMLSPAGAAGCALNVVTWMSRLRKIRPHVVHLDYAGWAPSLACAAHMLHIPVVGRPGPYNENNRANGWIDAYAANCAAHAASLLASPLASRVVVTGSVCRLDRLEPPYIMSAPIPPRRDRVVRFLFLGQLVPRKGIDVLVTAFARMAARDCADLVLVGGNWAEEGFPRQVRETAARLGLASHVHFENHRDDVPALLASCDALVLPSRSDARPRTIIEAMYLGKPVVATTVGGIPSLVEHGVTGLLVPPDDADALAIALDSIAADANLRHHLGEAAGQRCRQDLLPQRVASVYVDMYRRLALGLN